MRSQRQGAQDIFSKTGESGGDEGGDGGLHGWGKKGGGEGVGEAVPDGGEDAVEGAFGLAGGEAQGCGKGEEVVAPEAVFLAVEGQGEFFEVVGEDDVDGHEVVGGGEFPAARGGFEEGKVLEVHVGVAGEEAVDGQLEEGEGVKTGGVGEAADGLSDLFHGAVVFLGGHFAEDLAEVFHVAGASGGAVHAAANVGEFAGVEREEAEFGGRESASPRKEHGEMLGFGEVRPTGGGRFEDVVSGEVHEGQSGGGAGMSGFEVQGEFGLDARNGYAVEDGGFGKGVEFRPRAGQHRRARGSEESPGTSGMVGGVGVWRQGASTGKAAGWGPHWNTSRTLAAPMQSRQQASRRPMRSAGSSFQVSAAMSSSQPSGIKPSKKGKRMRSWNGSGWSGKVAERRAGWSARKAGS